MWSSVSGKEFLEDQSVYGLSYPDPGQKSFILVWLLSLSLQVKIELPTQLHEKHHILFSFYHVTCDINAKANAKKKEMLETSGTDRMRSETALHVICVTWTGEYCKAPIY